MDHAKSSIWLTWELHPDPSNCQAVASAVRKTMNKLNRSEEHTSELQSRSDLVCRLLLEKKKNKTNRIQREVSFATADHPHTHEHKTSLEYQICRRHASESVADLAVLLSQPSLHRTEPTI